MKVLSGSSLSLSFGFGFAIKTVLGTKIMFSALLRGIVY